MSSSLKQKQNERIRMSRCRKIALIFAVSCVAGCATKHVIRLDALTNVQVTSTNVTVLRLTGVYPQSALAVGETQIERVSDQVLLVRTFSRLLGKGTSGKVNLEIIVDDDVSAVAFGNAESIIWSRSDGVSKGLKPR
jgi:hypothetical protein